MKHLIVLLICLLTVSLSFSQTDSTLITNGVLVGCAETVVKYDALVLANERRLAKMDTLYSIIDNKNIIINRHKTQITELQIDSNIKDAWLADQAKAIKRKNLGFGLGTSGILVGVGVVALVMLIK